MRRSISLMMTALAATLLLQACQSVQPTQEPVSATQNAMNDTDFNLPEIPPAKLFQHATPEIFELNNGMTVWYVHNPMIPLMTLRVVFDRGAADDPANKSGRTSMTSAMLKEGANGKTAQQLSNDIENLGATISPFVTQDSSGITVQSLSQFFEQSLDIMNDIWLKPDFTQESFDRLQKIILNGLKQREDSPNAIAKLASNRAYFGEDHPYGRPVDGYISTISAMTVDDIKNCYQTIFTPSHAAFMAVGNIETAELKRILNDRYGSLKYEKQADTDIKPVEPEHKLKVVIVDKPNAPQTVIRIYQPAIQAMSMKTLTWQFVNIPFGGSFTSRLMQNIREDKGFSYGANSAIAPQKYAGVLLSSSAVSSDVTGPALKEFIYELERLPKGDFTQEEFERARETWKSELVQSFETQSGVLATIAALYLNKKSTDAINGFARELQNYDLDKFNAITKEFPTLDQATIVLVGDKTLILDQIKDMGLPEPEIRDVEGKLVNN